MIDSTSILRIERARKIGLTFVLLFGLGGFIAGLFSWKECLAKYDWRMAELATSISGTAGVLWSAAGVILIYVVYLGQKVEIIQQKEELRLTREQITDQKEQLRGQREQMEEQSRVMQKQFELSLAAHDFAIAEGLIKEYIVFLDIDHNKYGHAELLKGAISDIKLYISETNSNQDSYVEFLPRTTLPDVKMVIITHSKFSLAAITYIIERGKLSKMEKAILVNELLKHYSKAVHHSCDLVLTHLSQKDVNGDREPRFSHPNFDQIEWYLIQWKKIESFRTEYVSEIFY